MWILFSSLSLRCLCVFFIVLLMYLALWFLVLLVPRFYLNFIILLFYLNLVLIGDQVTVMSIDFKKPNEKAKNRIERVSDILEQIEALNRLLEFQAENDADSGTLKQYEFMRSEFIDELGLILKEFKLDLPSSFWNAA